MGTTTSYIAEGICVYECSYAAVFGSPVLYEYTKENNIFVNSQAKEESCVELFCLNSVTSIYS